MTTLPITKRGAEKLKAELHQLKTVDRPWVIGAIAEARAQGDLSENAEYDAPKTVRVSLRAGFKKLKASYRPHSSLTRSRLTPMARLFLARPLTWKTKTPAIKSPTRSSEKTRPI